MRISRVYLPIEFKRCSPHKHVVRDVRIRHDDPGSVEGPHEQLDDGRVELGTGARHEAVDWLGPAVPSSQGRHVAEDAVLVCINETAECELLPQAHTETVRKSGVSCTIGRTRTVRLLRLFPQCGESWGTARSALLSHRRAGSTRCTASSCDSATRLVALPRGVMLGEIVSGAGDVMGVGLGDWRLGESGRLKYCTIVGDKNDEPHCGTLRLKGEAGTRAADVTALSGDLCAATAAPNKRLGATCGRCLGAGWLPFAGRWPKLKLVRTNFTRSSCSITSVETRHGEFLVEKVNNITPTTPFFSRPLLQHLFLPSSQHLRIYTVTMPGKNLKETTFFPASYTSPPYTVNVPGAEKNEGETAPRRNTQNKDKLWTVPEEGINTLFDVLRRSSEKFGNARALGKRKLIKLHTEKTKVKKIIDGKETEVEKAWQYYEQSGYEYLSYIEFEQLCKKAGSALNSLGLKNPDRVHLFAATHPFWLAFAHGAWTLNCPIVTAYDTLGEEGLKHSLAQTNAKAIFLDPSNITKLINPLKETKDIQIVIYNDDESPVCKGEPEKIAADVKKLQDAHPDLKIFSWSDFLKLGETPHTPNPPKPEDLACIMYTSGSTGVPKGVWLTHGNAVGAVAGLEGTVGKYLGPKDGFITFLPLAHIFELVLENTCLFWGTTMGYGHPKTISDASAKNCRGDIAEFKPTIMVGVPAVWEAIKKGIVGKVNAMSPLVRNLFWASLATKSFLAPYLAPLGLETSLIDAVVFKKLREATGGRLRLTMNGGGPIAKDTQRFISMTIAPLLSGYGLTETAAMGAFTDPLGWNDDSLGAPTASVEMKLVDFADAGYFSTNNPPQGEIWIRGASVATGGYLNLEEETKEAFTSDGWFKTGDIGEFNSKGNLRIIDRKKNLVKTLNGEYIALEKLESIYRTNPIVQNICVYAAQDKNKPIAIVSVIEKALAQKAKEIGVDKQGDALLHDPKVNKAVLQEMQATGKKAGFAPFELLEGVALTDEEWTPQSVSF